MDPDVQDWLRIAESDVTSAEVLHDARQELNAIFFLQQAVEKTLKAVLIKRTSLMPPRIHNLPELAGRCELKLAREQERLLKDLTVSYIDSRYPEQWGSAPPEISSEKTGRLIMESKEFIAWLKQKL
jgi:HEPN domain-containing protein